MKKYKSLFKEDENDKSAEAIKDLVDTNWGGSNEEQGKAAEIIKGLSFSDSSVANKFMKKLDTLTSGLKAEDFKESTLKENTIRL